MLPNQLMQNVRQVKQMMNMFKNPAELIKNNPMLNQVMQAYNGQDPQQIFMSLCKKQGIDPEAIIQELRS